MTEKIRLAISGTYSTGKSTTTEALSIATGIPRTHAMTSREILMEMVPGKTVMELNAMELVLLAMRRFEERVHNEGVGVDSFISDGGCVHEWVYFEARMRIGINPGNAWWLGALKTLAGLPVKRFYQQYTDMLGVVTKARARRVYDAYVHLPVEFDMDPDGHRPVSEPFRRLSEQLLLEALEEVGLPYHIVGGTVRERLEKIISIFDFPVIVPLDEAIEEAERRVASAIEVLKSDARYHEAQRQKSLRRRIAWALRY